MRQVRSFILPITVLVFIPTLILFESKEGRLRINLFSPIIQIGSGTLLCLIGILILVITIRMLMQIGKGTLAPWDATTKLVTEGIYSHTRNPMISGVLITLLGESILFGSIDILIWFIAFFIGNTLYFRFSEEPGLIKRFGEEYLEYKKNVPMWFPRLSSWRKKRNTPD